MAIPPVTPSPKPFQEIEQVQKREENPQLRKVSRQFEAVFMNQLIESMRKTVPRENGLIPESGAERTFRGMLDSQYAEQIAETDQIGLSRLIYDHLLRTQSGQ